MAIDPNKLFSTYSNVSHTKFDYPRFYTITHSDETGDIFMDIGDQPNKKLLNDPQTLKFQDQVIGEWITNMLILEVVLFRKNIPFDEDFRLKIFNRELPRVIKIIKYLECSMFNRNPGLLDSKIVVIYRSDNGDYSEELGMIKDF
jgi:hypothetical protein